MREDKKIHYNNMDIVQRLMGETMKGYEPLKIFKYSSAKVKEVLSTDLPKIETVDDKADTLYLLENGDFLHVEYQSTTEKEDIYRFAAYCIRLYNKVRKKSFKGRPDIQTVVIYSPLVSKKHVEPSMDIGSIKFNFYPIFLNEFKENDDSATILDKIKENPNTSLSKEEQLRLVYQPLFNDNITDIEKDAYYLIRNINELKDELLKAHLSSSIYVLVHRFLSQDGELKIWEVLSKMSVVEKELKRKFGYDAGIESIKQNIFHLLVDAIRKNEPESTIQYLVKAGRFTDEEVKKAYSEANR